MCVLANHGILGLGAKGENQGRLMRRGDDTDREIDRRMGAGAAADARMGVCVCCDGLGRVGFVRATVLGGMQLLLLILSLIPDQLLFWALLGVYAFKGL